MAEAKRRVLSWWKGRRWGGGQVMLGDVPWLQIAEASVETSQLPMSLQFQVLPTGDSPVPRHSVLDEWHFRPSGGKPRADISTHNGTCHQPAVVHIQVQTYGLGKSICNILEVPQEERPKVIGIDEEVHGQNLGVTTLQLEDTLVVVVSAVWHGIDVDASTEDVAGYPGLIEDNVRGVFTPDGDPVRAWACSLASSFLRVQILPCTET